MHLLACDPPNCFKSGQDKLQKPGTIIMDMHHQDETIMENDTQKKM